MTVKKFIALTAAICAVSATAFAEVEVDVVSAYVFRGGTINDEVNIQPGFGTDILGGAVSVGTWANFNTDTSEFDEIDYFFGIPIPLGEDSPVAIEVGYCEYVYNEGGEADREPYITFSAEGVTLGVYYGIAGLIDKTLYLDLGYEKEVAVVDNIAVTLGANLGYLEPDEGESGFSHLTLSASTSVGIPETDYSLSIGVTYIVETDEDVQAIDEDFYVTVGTAL